MTPLTRRTFLGAGVAAGAAIGLESRLTVSAQADSGSLADAKHVVILMQENRSFDHYFGTLRGVRGFGDRATIQIAGGHSVFDQPNGAGRQYPWQFSATSAGAGGDPERLAQCNGDLKHAWSDQHAAWNAGRLDSWVAAKGNLRTLGYLTRDDLPLHYALADSWTIADGYFSSVLGSTGPNRTYHWSGQIDPDGTAGGPAYDGGEESGLRWETYAEALERAGVSWKVYQNAQDNYTDNALAYFDQFSAAPASSPLRTRGMSSVPRVSGNTPDDIAAAIRADVLAGTLPQVSWIVPNQEASEHPFATPADGAHFVRNVIMALSADPAVFNATIMFLNYDENDGFFDHVPPPVAPAGTPAEFFKGANIGLGFRVPLIAISPWSRGGWVYSGVADHTSVLRFLERWTAAIGKAARCPNISAWRREVCSDLTGMFDFTRPVYGLPELPTVSTIGMAGCATVANPAPVDNRPPTQEQGTRPARALPYQPRAWFDRWETGNDGGQKLWITFANDGTTGTCFATYANAHRSGGPWSYTVSAGAEQRDYFNIGQGYGNGAYDFTVIGPNRFLRQFAGDTAKPGANLRVRERYAVSPSTGKLAIWFDLINSGPTPLRVIVRANAYRSDGPWPYTVQPGQTLSDYFNAVHYSNGWYDLTLTCLDDPTWSQRFTGHLETGAPSVSG